MKHNELHHLMALQKLQGLSDRQKKQLVVNTGGAIPLFKSGLLKGLGNPKSLLNAVQTELAVMDKHHILATGFNQAEYPRLLKHCADGPLVLYSKGNIDWSNPRIISIVGTRKMTLYGQEFCNKLVRDLASYNPIIVSGLAFGVDITAHKAAIKNGLQTVACLAHGLHKIQPATHTGYRDKILANGGLVSDFWTNQKFNNKHFLQRNRIIAGLSKATIVVESAVRGGSLVTADIAFSYDRELFAVPGQVSNLQSQGCNNLIKSNQAQILTKAQDIVDALGWEKPRPTKKRQTELFAKLTKTEQHLVKVMTPGESVQLDVLARKSSLSLSEVASLLLSLELKGQVIPKPGKRFVRA